MKCSIRKHTITILILFISVIMLVIPKDVKASDQPEGLSPSGEILQRFHATLCSDDQKRLFLEQITWKEIPAPIDNCNIQDIAISDMDVCAILLSRLSEKALFLYNSDGSYILGYSFQAKEKCSIFFNNQLYIYFVRSEYLLAIDPSFETVDVYYCLASQIDNLSLLLKDVKTLTHKQQTFWLKRIPNWIPSTVYSTLVYENSDGTQTILYNNELYGVRGAVITGSIILFIIYVVFMLINKLKVKKQ